MAKKRKPKRRGRGWPRPERATGESHKTHVADRVLQKLKAGTLDEATGRRYTSRLLRLLDTWPELGLARPSWTDVEAAIAPLSEADRDALHGVSGSSARVRRVHGRVLPELFDDQLLDECGIAFRRGLARATADDDIGALVCALFWLARTQRRARQPEDDPLLAVLLTNALLGRLQLVEELGELGLLRTRDQEQPAADEMTEEEWLSKALEASPRMQADYRRRVYREAGRLAHLMTDGTIRAHLSRDELAPLVEQLQPIVEAMSDEQREDLAAALMSSEEADALYAAFADDPANEPAFARFTEQLNAEAQATEGDPAAEPLRGAAAFWRIAHAGFAGMRQIIAQTSLLRLLEAGEVTLSPQAPDEG